MFENNKNSEKRDVQDPDKINFLSDFHNSVKKMDDNEKELLLSNIQKMRNIVRGRKNKF